MGLKLGFNALYEVAKVCGSVVTYVFRAGIERSRNFSRKLII
jgi:hypothetical protein